MPLIDAPSWGVFSLLTGPTALAVLAVLAANLTSHVLKRLIGRERPPAEQWLVEASNYSLPSGHATGAAAFAMALTLIIRWRAWLLLAWRWVSTGWKTFSRDGFSRRLWRLSRGGFP